MKFVKGLLLTFILLSGLNNYAQEVNKERLFPEGQPVLRVFTNFHAGISEGNDALAFELDRAYLGYQMNLTEDFSMKIVLDIGSPDDISEFSKIRRYAYFKNASLTYKKAFIKIDFGLIDMIHFKMQEDFWGHRYIEKSFADRFKFGPSADLGVDAVFDIQSKVKIDLTLSNGEGYTNLQRDNIFKAGLGAESEVFKGFFVRIYSDLLKNEIIESTGAIFAGYKYKKVFSAGAEYNWKLNESYQQDHNRQGYSVYGSWNLPRNFELFARYDFVNSSIVESEEEPWDLARDGSSVTGGVQFKPVEKVKLAVSYRDWYPYANNLDNEAFIYLNLEFKY